MIGNDIVDLLQAAKDSNWQRRGFLDKLFTDSEQQFIYEASSPEHMVWLLWSLKESAYKARFRETEHRVFSPKKIACVVNKLSETVAEATVIYGCEYQANSVITPEYIASVAYSSAVRSQPVNSIILFSCVDYQNQHVSLCEAVTDHISGLMTVSQDAVFIRKTTGGTPAILVDFRQIPLSLSHHGRYGAYTFDPI